MNGSFVVFVPLPKGRAWAGVSVPTNTETGFTIQEAIKRCEAEEIIDGNLIGLWKPDEDFCAIIPCDSFCAISSKGNRENDPMFFGMNILHHAFIYCYFHDGLYWPFHNAELNTVVEILQNKQTLWRQRIRSEEPSTNFTNVDDLIREVNNE